ncbi:MAG: hypothetical protein QM296_11530, partial [Bacillota bacterium]|nr:hypothetical protein [Bacillota bacterium]
LPRRPPPRPAPKNLPPGGQKLRWRPAIGAGPKKLTSGGQKLRWCPGLGAGAKKLSKGGQKLRWCPQIGAGTKKLSTDGQKLRWCPGQPQSLQLAVQHRRVLFLFFSQSGGKRIDRKQSYGRHLLCCSEMRT